MGKVRRGDIYWSDLNPIRGSEAPQRRPLLVLSQEIFNQSSGTVIALMVTSQPQAAEFPLSLPVTSVKLPKQAWIKLSQIRTLSVDRLGKRIGALSAEELARVEEGLKEIIGFE